MAALNDNGRSTNPEVTFDDVERVLAVGRLLLSVLTPEELDQLRHTLDGRRESDSRAELAKQEIGNAGVS